MGKTPPEGRGDGGNSAPLARLLEQKEMQLAGEEKLHIRLKASAYAR